jgi:6-pyruvoyltetrahydropterin/6-carboxytetrahydropterin synthase
VRGDDRRGGNPPPQHRARQARVVHPVIDNPDTFDHHVAGKEAVPVSFQIVTSREFAAAHQLRLYDGTLEPLHGHNWRVAVTVASENLDSIGVVMDFHELARLVDKVVGPMHNRHLNELEPFAKLKPSAENVALVIARGLRLPEQVKLRRVEVWETPQNSAVYSP